jgi:hypothetical protein
MFSWNRAIPGFVNFFRNKYGKKLNYNMPVLLL